MEWDMKLPPNWDLTQLGGSSSSSSSSLRGRDCSVVLKLGGSESGMMVPSSSGSGKRARALPGNGGTVVSCLVEGCGSDLSNCREYHRRHKVCEAHSKTAVVMVGGREQRFCQQCSRFHLLVEFDEVKRSCRKRLDGHNRRRRKPQHDFINTRSLFTNHPGAGFSVYPQIFPAAASVTNWSRIIKSEEDVLYSNSLPLHLSDRQQSSTISPCHYKAGKQFPFLQEEDHAIRSRMVSQTAFEPETKTIASSETDDRKLYHNEIPGVFSTKCALSLLSSSSQTSSMNVSQAVPSDRIPIALPLVSGFQFNDLGRYSCPQASDNVSRLSPSVFSCSGMKDDQMVNVFVPDASEAGLRCGCIFQACGDGSSESISQGLPYPWQ